MAFKKFTILSAYYYSGRNFSNGRFNCTLDTTAFWYMFTGSGKYRITAYNHVGNNIIMTIIL